MAQTPFFSVIVPVYGVEPYLEQALTDLVNQTISDREILLVDDASPDGSGAICRRYAARYPDITVLTHSVNRGLSAARNTGLQHARGQYVWFMDPDDRVDTTLLEQVYRSLEQHAAQVVVFGCTEEYIDRRGQLVGRFPIHPSAGQWGEPSALRREVLKLEADTLYGYAWNKVYAVEHIRREGLRFETVPLIEDIRFNVAFFQQAESLNVLPTAPYHYMKRQAANLTARFVPEYYALHRERIRLLYQQQQAWGTLDEAGRRLLAGRFVRYVFSAAGRNCDPRSGMTEGARRTWLKQVMADPLLLELLPYAKPEGRALRVMTDLLRRRDVTGCALAGRAVYTARTRLRPLFDRAGLSRV